MWGLFGEEDEDATGVELLARHLAKCKLKHAEEIYVLQTTLGRCQERCSSYEHRVQELETDIKEYQDEIRRAETEGTRKRRIGERDSWKSLVDTLRRDKTELAERNNALLSENERLQQLVTSVSGGNVGASAAALRQQPKSEKGSSEAAHGAELGRLSPVRQLVEANGTLSSIDVAQEASMLRSGLRRAESVSESEQQPAQAERIELDALRIENEELHSREAVLRKKLDLELELKWERTRRVERTFFESFLEILAPSPDESFPPSPRASPRAVATAQTSVGGSEAHFCNSPEERQTALSLKPDEFEVDCGT